MTTLTTKVARKIQNETGLGRNLFNDRLQDGSRSLKVWGWSDKQYKNAAQKLRNLGCEVKIVCFKSRSYGSKHTQTRLHVVEPA